MPPTCGMVMALDIAWAGVGVYANALDGVSVVGLALVCIM